MHVSLICLLFNVAPYAGAWIEIKDTGISQTTFSVAPYAGAWIEIPTTGELKKIYESLLMQERGLK